MAIAVTVSMPGLVGTAFVPGAINSVDSIGSGWMDNRALS
jgi:hypothetical protein